MIILRLNREPPAVYPPAFTRRWQIIDGNQVVGQLTEANDGVYTARVGHAWTVGEHRLEALIKHGFTGIVHVTG